MTRISLVLGALVVACVSPSDEPGEVVIYNGKPGRMAIDGDDVYWFDQSLACELRLYRGSLDAIPIARDDADLMLGLYTEGAATAATLAIDAASVYAVDQNEVIAIPRIGGAAAHVFTSTGDPLEIAIQDDTLFWITGGLGETLYWVPLSGGLVTSVTLPDETLGLVVDAENLYIRGYVGVYAVSRATRVVTKLAAVTDYESLYPDRVPMVSSSMAKNGDVLHWAIHQLGMFADQDRGAIIQIPLSGGEPRVLQTDLFSPHLVTVDASGATYWFESLANHHPSFGVSGIRRLGPGESTATTVVDAVVPGAMTTSDGFLYWSTPGSDYDFGQIRRIAIP